MKKYGLLILPLCGLLVSLAPAKPTPARVPVVVELFTSEGCSSCPAADAALRELEAAQAVPGADVIVLGEHVDYWNKLGWKDAFSAPAFTARQRQYAQQFGTGSYTPQAVVNGRYELVGSHTSELKAAVAKAATLPTAALSLTVDHGQAQVHVRSLPADTPAVEVLLALTESGLSSQVGRGENSGRLLRHAAVVRQLIPLGRVRADGTFGGAQALTLPAAWQRPHVRVVALVQETASRRIVGVAAASLPSE
ncbi:DUF1223 domain-containing protein [Hymenobacter convexus]|uniref:DUF1223 domain-containing protein n=1 Tax=Hymenobacter sp. CA1UV-4 TaxID=3063782 RepID=UPI002712BF9D|nr:DUF1223 domain-containing protein [Hymenobacter sp. CA1UV-4]MDO7854143.1 DUF1223 domain-containing protein [Hymenobacter sp. CA1UV-4]